jgi:hypothetical protein
VLVGSTKNSVYAAGYPDSGKLLVESPRHGFRKLLADSPDVDYWVGESEG